MNLSDCLNYLSLCRIISRKKRRSSGNNDAAVMKQAGNSLHAASVSADNRLDNDDHDANNSTYRQLSAAANDIYIYARINNTTGSTDV